MDIIQTSSPVVVPAGRVCPRCGARLGGFGPEGLCGVCLLDSGLGVDAPEPAVEIISVIPQKFGDYEILGELARGGMGVVLKARQISLNRIVALKVIRAGDLAGPIELRRFREEAQTAAGLQHPNIVAIHEVGEGNGLPFFSMEYIEGQDLATLVRENPLPATRAASYLKTIAVAVQFAHERGVLHRDLKPSNVLIDMNDQPRVTDFGLAKHLTSDASLTLSGQIIGSPSFMSPEQAAGGDGVGPASDVYSLGALLYHLLTARPPFVAESVPATLRLVAESEPASPHLLVPSLPRDLETICLKCLQKEPLRRYATAKELADDLGCFLRGEPISARPVSAAERCWRWALRNRALAVACAATVLLLLAVVAMSLRTAWRIQLDETKLREQLAESLLAQARAENRSEEAGKRDAALAAVRKAATLHPTLELRNEAIAALSQTDLHLTEEVWKPQHNAPGPAYVLDPAAKHFVYLQTNGLVFERTLDGGIEFTLGCPLSGPAFAGRLQFGGQEKQWLLAQTASNTLQVWHLPRQQLVWRTSPQAERPPRATFIADHDELLVNMDGTNLMRVDLVSGMEANVGVLPQSRAGFVISPDGRTVAAWFGSNYWLTAFSTMTWGPARQSPLPISSVRFDHDSSRMICELTDHSLWVWELEGQRAMGTVARHSNAIVGWSAEASSRWLATSSWDGTTRLWDLFSGHQEVVSTLSGSALRWHADLGKFSLRLYSTHGVRWFDLQQPTVCWPLVPRFENLDAGLASPAVSHNGRLIAAGSEDTLNLLEVSTGKILARLPPQDIGRLTPVFEPGDRALLCATAGGLFRWPLQWRDDGKLECGPITTVLATGACQDLALDPPGRWLALALDSGEIRLRNLAGNWRVIPNRGNAVLLDFSPDGRWLAGGASDESWLRIWDTATGKLKRELACASGVRPRFCPDGRLAAETSAELDFFDVDSGALLRSLPRDYLGSERGNVVFSGDGQFLAFSRSRTRVDLLHVPTLEVLASFSDRENVAAILALDEHATKLVIGQNRQFYECWDLRKLRAELAALNLDWNCPPLPSLDPSSVTPIKIEMVR